MKVHTISIPLETVFYDYGFEDAVSYLRNVKGHDKTLRLYACYCVKLVLPIFEKQYPDDNRPRQAIETAERFALGLATEMEIQRAAFDALVAEQSAAKAVGFSVGRAALNATKMLTRFLAEAMGENASAASSLAVADFSEDAVASVKKAWEGANAAWHVAVAVFDATVGGEDTGRFMTYAAVEAFRVAITEKAAMEHEFIRLCRLEGDFGVVPTFKRLENGNE